MKTRFLHCADIHLGYMQYGRKERYNDFAAAFNAVIDKATGVYQPRFGKELRFDERISGPVDFVVLAGDLFHKRSIDALTLNQAMRALRRLRDAGIPCIAVEGNHERAYYEDTIGWMKFLALQDLIILLDAELKDGEFDLQPWDPVRRQGAFFEPKPGVRVYGLRYYGASTVTAIGTYVQALAKLPRGGVQYSIFVTHAGVEGEMDDKAGGVAFRQWSALRDYVDYVALGHFHKPYILDKWVHNPGSPEACSISETVWSPRGYLVVDVDAALSDDVSEQGGRHQVFQGNTPRRAFRQYNYKTDHASSPEELIAGVEEYVNRKAIELADELTRRGCTETSPPVIELYLAGVLPFDRRALDITRIEAIVHGAFKPLVAQVKTVLQNADFDVDPGETPSRAELEQRVLAGLFGRDSRFAGQSEQWARAASSLKQLVLSGAPPEAILDELDGYLGADDSDPAP